MTGRSVRWLLALLLTAALVAVGVVLLRDSPENPDNADVAVRVTPSGTPDPTGAPDDADDPGAAIEEDLAVAISDPREDSYYPDVGDPGVDSLHHDLDLAWDPETRTLKGTDTLTFRATTDAATFQLDLSPALSIQTTTLDGTRVEHSHDGKNLVIEAAVTADEQYELQVDYSGSPEPVAAPTKRGDIPALGWTVTDTGEVWTMQEPYGAYTWYPVNDQPADKALYDFTIRAPRDWVGIANGALTDRRTVDDQTVTTFHTDEPMASYLTTIAIGDYDLETQETASGVPISLWVPADKPGAMRKVRKTKQALEWVEGKLGPYPFSTAGVLVTDSDSGMETQTLITLGDNDYVLSKPVLVHELVHQWYGDQVTPLDWRDVWMNEGMTMYLQSVYESEHGGQSLDAIIDQFAASDPSLRASSGPPGSYDADNFGGGNIYYLPAVMWHELRAEIGDEAFWKMVRAWPQVHDNAGATREEYYDWIEETTGRELSDFFDAWISGQTTPDRG